MLRVSLLVLAVLTGCPAPTVPTVRAPRATSPTPPPSAPAATVSWARVVTADDVPEAPPPGTYRLHLIDVGTGLAILVQGADFTLLYDAGTNDPGERPARVIAYLAAALGASGDELCVEPGSPLPASRRAIDHVVLSHPHLDHASALERVFHCYEVADFWEPGRPHDRVFYRELLAKVATTEARYHTAATVPADRRVRIKGLTIELPRWDGFGEGDVVELGEGARFTILHANAKPTSDPNENSLVLAVQLGRTTALLVGDAESGPRKDPSYPAGDVEAHLIDHHGPAIRAHVLQVGHHGSMTSSRRAFLEAVAPSLALVSSGPKSYGGTTLPDPEVLDELARVGATVLRTDVHDAGCPEVGRIGGDVGPGGCDAWVLTIGP